ncbi:MAG: methyltransferase domain-containing protein [Rhodobacteraceae bacterium]|nr:methyltransferase domain-containing protein [Paracoccaceae bacterium]
MTKKMNSQAVGLDIGLSFIKWLTGAENLHYGIWTNLKVTAGNLGQAQSVYTEKLFSYLPSGSLRILDVGGGAGETARKLIALGHQVDIVVPSLFLAERCRANAPQATVHLCKFEDFETDQEFDLCIFSESFQYIPYKTAIDRAKKYVKSNGNILIADCFRTTSAARTNKMRRVGGGHSITEFQSYLQASGINVTSSEDVTTAVAPSIDLEQELFNVFGHAVKRVDVELQSGKPTLRWFLMRLLRMILNEKRRYRLTHRLFEKERTSEAFITHNQYMIFALQLG